MSDERRTPTTELTPGENKIIIGLREALVVARATSREREIGRQEGWDLALRWLRERASSHAGRWMTMDPREAIKATVEEMETLNVNG